MAKRLKSVMLIIAILISSISFTNFEVYAKDMSISENGIKFLKAREGYRQYQYWDNKQYSIGYGSKTYNGEYPNGITKEEATNLLRKQVKTYEKYVNNFLSKNNIIVNQNQFDALVSFTYNLGNVWNSKQYPTFVLKTCLLKGVDKCSEKEIRTGFGNWNKANGKANAGLTTRRKLEADLFLSGDDKTPVSEDELTKDTKYKTPILCVAYKKMDIYYSSGKVESGRYISAGDECTIKAVYTNGLCSLTYPTSNGSRTAYAKFKDFTPNSVSLSTYKADKAYTTYKHSDKKKKYGSLSIGDSCTIVGKTGNLYQIIYPVSSGYKLGWIDKDELKDIAPPVVEADLMPKMIPLAVVKGFLNGKSIVVMASDYFQVSGQQTGIRYVSKDDVCIIRNINSSTGKCTMDYPINGNDVFWTSRDTCTTNITNIITQYSADYSVYKLVALENYKVYPTPSKVDDKNRNWQLDKGDEYYTIARSGNMTEVLYYCNRGTHNGYWKMGWIEIPYYYLDLNGQLDGTYNGKLSGYGYVDVIVNGETTKQAQDYYKEVPYGSTYEIKNPVATSRHTYKGVYAGTLSGTVKAKTEVRLNFVTDPVILQDIYISSLPNKTEYIEGESFDATGLAVIARYDDASTKDITTSCELTGYDSTPGSKVIMVKYSGQETAFTVNVEEKSPVTLELSSLPQKTVYKIGDEINLSGLNVKATFNNGISALIDEYDAYYDEDFTFDSGSKKIDIIYLYNDVVQEASFNIEISDYSGISTLQTVIYNGHIYQSVYVEDISWNGANVIAQKKGGYLATITDEQENDVIRSMISNGKSCYIGIAYDEESGNWNLISDEEYNYENWNTDTQNNNANNESIGEMDTYGKWNENNKYVSDNSHIFVIEYVPELESEFNYNGHLYKIFNNAPNDEIAQEYCEYLGGNLATITTEEENSEILKYLLSENEYFVGICSDESNNWRWITGENTDYSNWNADEPNAESLATHSVTISSSGEWNITDKDTPYGFIFETGTIWNVNAPLGDVNDNGIVDKEDAALILKYASGIDVDINTAVADYNNDTNIDVRDAIAILNMSGSLKKFL